MEVAMLTTVDNPHDPFDDFRAWFAFDTRHGYHTTSYIARLSFNSHELSDADQNAINTEVIDDILKENITGMYRKVTREVPDP